MSIHQQPNSQCDIFNLPDLICSIKLRVFRENTKQKQVKLVFQSLYLFAHKRPFRYNKNIA